MKPPHRLIVLAALAAAFSLLSGAAAPSRARADGCRHADVVFYTSDSQRLAQRLAANPSACADYFVSVTPGGTDSLTPRPIAAAIRANGPQFHAIAEIRAAAWGAWVASTGITWFDAGVEARARMKTAGYDVASGDTWAVNELGANVLAGTGSSRADFRDFVRGLYTGDGTPSPGLVFMADPLHTATDLTSYEQQLQDLLVDTPFWTDMAQDVRFWGQEVYADARLWGVDGADLATRAAELNEYLQHALTLAEAGPGSASAARSFLERAYTPVANAAWPQVPDEVQGTGFGFTNVVAPVMEAFIASQAYAMRAYSASTGPGGTDRFGFAWIPKTAGIPAATFIELLDRMATAIHGSESDPAGACAAEACDGTVDAAHFNDAWAAFAQWSPPTNTPEGSNVAVAPAPGVSVVFASVTSRGSTQATASPDGPPPPAGFLLRAGSLYYDLETTAAHAGPVDVCLAYGGADYTGLTPRLFHLAGGAWVDVTTTLDAASQAVCGRADSLSPFVVFGVDATPPVLTVSAGVTADAIGPAGAVVTYAASAVDTFDPAPVVTCSPASGAGFPIGDTVVSCTAGDAAGNTAEASFTVHVAGAAEQLADLAGAVNGVGPGNGLAVTVAAAQWFVAHGQPRVACVTLSAFMIEVQVWSGRKIPPAQASALLADARRIKAVLGCS